MQRGGNALKRMSNLSGIILSMQAQQLRALLLLLLASGATIAYGQQTADVSFKLDFPGSNPSHYEIVVASDGHGTYTSDGKLDEHSDPISSSPMEFKASDSIRTQLFDLAKRAHYFSGKADSERKNVANTGTKTLAYKGAGHSSQVTYNYSTQQPIQQITALFQGLSTTLECGKRLAYLHKYEKLALDDELKRMLDLQEQNSLVDIQAIAPILKAIADDSSVINVSRVRALRLLSSQK
jgi:hypothetical protein